VARAVRDMTALLAGKRVDLSGIALDMDGVPPFHRRAYAAARAIPAGRTRSYGELAAGLGSPNSLRAVGQAMRRNPFPIVVPCHRVLAAGGRAGGFTAAGGVDTKMRMLEIEGAKIEVRATKACRATIASPGELPFDPKAALRALRSQDAVLARLIDDVGPLRLRTKTTGSVFGALAEAIVYQQLTGKAAATILGRVHALAGPRRLPRPEDIRRLRADRLRAAGLSRAKVLAVKDLALKTLDGTVPTLARLRRMEDAEIVERLTSIRGVGTWTAEMLLIFRLGRPDVLPATDYGIRKGFQKAFGLAELPTPTEVLQRGEAWRPFRTLPSWYLWRVLDGNPG